MIARSLLFAPANRPDLFNKFPRLQADLFVLDLEDGTPPAERAEARKHLARSVESARGDRARGSLYVRINPASTADCRADLEAVRGSSADGIVLAKAESRDQIATLDSDLPVIAGIESIQGVLKAAEIASAPAVVALYFGAEDFAAEMGAQRSPEGLEVLYARSRVVLAAKASRLRALDQVVVDFRDDERFRQDARFARSLGYDGKMCIHPRQLALANEAFSPTAEEVDYARRLLDAFEEARARGEATIDFEGRMVDGPLVKSARSILQLVERPD